MGATGTISLVNEDDSSKGKRKFPAFRFPESAARALGKVVAYANFKNRSQGIIKWFDDVAADDARKEIQNIIENKTNINESITVKNDTAKKILEFFGFQIIDKKLSEDKRININVHQDKLFGPIIKLIVPGKPAVIHITPLTDRDIQETLNKIQLSSNNSLTQILGRISQLIEELPWLWRLETETFITDKITITNNILMELKPAGVKRTVL